MLIIGAGQQDYGLVDAPLGNGRAMARLFAREGANMGLADIDAASATTTRDQVCGERDGIEVVTVVGDAADPGDVERMLAEASGSLGGLDGLVLNVGIVSGDGNMLRGTTPEDWDRTMAMNLRSQYLACRCALEIMQPGGSVVMIGSIASREVMQYPAYAASKAGLEALCRQAAVEGAPALRFNLLLPGLIDSALGRLASRRDSRRDQAPIPAQRKGTAWETAYAALFLLSDEASYITGQGLIVDGGLSIGARA